MPRSREENFKKNDTFSLDVFFGQALAQKALP